MTTTDVPPLAPTSESYERRTRLLARAAALTLALAILLPRLWLDENEVLHALWVWDRGTVETDSWESSIQTGEGFAPSLALLLVLSLVAWVAAKRLPLARRGRWLVVPTVLCHSISANRLSDSDLVPHRLGGHLWLVLAGLGLVFSGMAAYRRLGTALCAMAGVLLVGNLLWPVGDWEWPLLRVFFDQGRTELAGRVFLALIVIGLAVGGLLLWTGLSKGNSRVVRRLAVLGLVAVIAVAFAANLLGSYDRTATQYAKHHAVAVWNTLRWFLRPYAEALLITVGLFAWIVGAREERTLGSVFD